MDNSEVINIVNELLKEAQRLERIVNSPNLSASRYYSKWVFEYATRAEALAANLVLIITEYKNG
jgi:hypothetical protein